MYESDNKDWRKGKTIPGSLNDNIRASTPTLDEIKYKLRRSDNLDKKSVDKYKSTSDEKINSYEKKNKNVHEIVPLSVEVCVRSDINIYEYSNSDEKYMKKDLIAHRIKRYFSLQANVGLGKIEVPKIGDSFLRKVCTDINLSLNYSPIEKMSDKDSLYCSSEDIPIYQTELNIYIYQLNKLSEEEYLCDDSNVSNEKNSESPIWRFWLLPNIEFDGLWDSLHYENGLKQQLMDYTSTSLILSDCGIDNNIINWNHLILLYGSPGTGKTSISRAISQKIGIRHFNKYQNIYLIEINAHSLFSKWFSESGKTVVKLFAKIRTLLEESDSFVIIIIDEIESISSARKQSLGRNEPSDSIRVVNALLTQIDSLKKYTNTLLMTTTNIIDSIDEAFLDRADLKLYIPLPSIYTRYLILNECIQELINKNVLFCNSDKSYIKLLNYKEAILYRNERVKTTEINISNLVLHISRNTEGFSGRNLRKLPFITLLSCHKFGIPLEIQTFIEKMKNIVDEKPEILRN
ncbi:Pch2p like AAA ATpase [Cryptosporidium ryanae]|uniref:Pch2p like AAA ATpase n=1 Tax=Cryptosporidium ryanae TaxID=515981 RepID=UPI003519F0A0|nr:Pch2p like AAA ATpase [Cryptosporidium ryanae]